MVEAARDAVDQREVRFLIMAGIPSPHLRQVSRRRQSKERGVAMIMFSFMVFTVVAPIIGFTVDGSVCYWMKTKLSSSVDAAALAAARSLSLAANSSELESTATSTASEYFTADFQTGNMGTSLPTVVQSSPCTTGTNPCTTVTVVSAQKIQVTVQATVTVPLYFLRLLGHSSQNLYDIGQSTRRSANVMLVLDRSYSMVEAGVCSTMVASAQNFVDYFVDGRDTLGLVTFQATANYDYPLTTTFKSGSPSLNSTLNSLQCTGYTTTAAALNMAYTELNALNQPDALNVIVLFTDGQPDSFVGTFQVKTAADNGDRYLWSSAESGTMASSSPASSCSVSGNQVGPGVITAADGLPESYGYVLGLFPNTGTAISFTDPYGPYSNPVFYPVPSATLSGANSSSPAYKCLFATTTDYPEYTLAPMADLAYMPSADAYGNSLSGYKPLETYSSGPYATYNRIDVPINIVYGAVNAAWNQANVIRNAGIYIYTIGLGGTPEEQIDSDFLMRIANDPTLPSSEYNSSQPAGLFIYATAGSLGQAFAQIASEILHLSE